MNRDYEVMRPLRDAEMFYCFKNLLFNLGRVFKDDVAVRDALHDPEFLDQVTALIARHAGGRVRVRNFSPATARWAELEASGEGRLIALRRPGR